MFSLPQSHAFRRLPNMLWPVNLASIYWMLSTRSMGCEYAYLNAICAHASYACCDFSCFVGCSESEKKTTLDQALRSVLGDLIVSIMNYKGHVTVVVYSLDLFVFICRLSKRRAVMTTCLSLTSALMQWLKVCCHLNSFFLSAVFTVNMPPAVSDREGNDKS